ncbi:hypothetical protein BJX66DRAFT_323457 [Aspergillus keveii]|uniref:FAD-binding PCMH-type domain-containing protein n=1 Tax=Aspergillus keveii TaxID=714993 RepID=A0ABR4GE53_9EURO
MPTSLEKGIALPPLLSQSHSGVPERLLSDSIQAKNRLWANKKTHAKTNKELPILPENISKEEFYNAIAELQGKLGSDNAKVVDTPLDDGWYLEHPNTHDAMHILEDDDLVASAVICPGSTSEVQTVVLWANKYRIPIYPISIGRNFGYGGAAPRLNGGVIVDLGKRMNKILDINPQDCTCLVEPGVTYFALFEEVQARGYQHLMVDVPDLGGGSVVGNALDRGVGYTPYGDHWATHSGLEVVLPNGEVSNLGIVTKMGVTLMPHPGDHEGFAYTFQKESDIAQLAEIIRPLRIAMILENVAQIRHVSVVLAANGKPRSAYYKGKGQIPSDILHEAASKEAFGDCTWIYYGMTYGPKNIRQWKLDLVHKEFMKVPGARQLDPKTLPRDDYFWVRDSVANGVPDINEINWVNWYPNGAHLAFSPIAPVRGTDALKLWEMASSYGNAHGLDLFPAFLVGLREMHLIVEIPYDRNDAEHRLAARKCLEHLINEAAKNGYGEYRTHLVFMDQVANTYSWNNNALMRFNERIKDALDPNGILAPGKSGVWPARFRGRNNAGIGKLEKAPSLKL